MNQSVLLRSGILLAAIQLFPLDAAIANDLRLVMDTEISTAVGNDSTTTVNRKEAELRDRLSTRSLTGLTVTPRETNLNSDSQPKVAQATTADAK